MPGLNRVNSDSKIELFCLLLDILLDKISLVNRNYFASVLEICLSSFRQKYIFLGTIKRTFRL